MRIIIFFLLTIITLACTKDRVIDYSNNSNVTNTDSVFNGLIKVNELLAKGSSNFNEFGSAEDWVEIYNNTSKDYVMKSGSWYITDDFSNKKKFQLPEISISAYSFAVIWCDSKDTCITQIHTNFNLSAGGEQVGIFYKDSLLNILTIDSIVFPAQSDGVSYGRLPNGFDNWVTFTVPTPGSSNY